MGKQGETGISWCDFSFNPWIGCTKVSAACKFCYAEHDMDDRLHYAKWGSHGTRVVTSDGNWAKPIYWNKNAIIRGESPRVFCASLSDVFELWDGAIHDHRGRQLFTINGVEWFTEGEYPECRPLTMDDVRARLFDLIDATPSLDWLLLTKRPENVRKMWRAVEIRSQQQADDRNERGELYRRNVWLGTSVENQETADKRIPALIDCRELSPVLFLSCEPLLGPVNLNDVAGKIGVGLHAYDVLNGRNFHWDDGGYWTPYDKIDWVIVGGESGHEARPMHPDWARSLRDQCSAARVPFHFKQWGRWQPLSTTDGMQNLPFGEYSLPTSEINGFGFIDAGKKAAGRILDGQEWNEFPVLTS